MGSGPEAERAFIRRSCGTALVKLNEPDSVFSVKLNTGGKKKAHGCFSPFRLKFFGKGVSVVSPSSWRQLTREVKYVDNC